MKLEKYFMLLLIAFFWSCASEEAGPEDCAGVPGGMAALDSCDVCDDNPNNNCVRDCAGVFTH